MTESTSIRLKKIMRDRNLRQADILRLTEPYCRKYNIKMNKSDLSQFVSGKVEPGQWKLTILGLALNVSEAWLMGCDVPMERSHSSDIQMPESQSLPANVTPLQTCKLPLLGTIACGTPILAEQNISRYIDVADRIHADFCLECKGDSMIGARIMDGDVVCIRIQPDVEHGQIAAVRIGEEATLKRVYKYPDKLVLQAENPAYEPLVYTKHELDDIEIIGKAIAFISQVK